jgi:tRNA(Arg) A34 adenosine deaminase TadA
MAKVERVRSAVVDLPLAERLAQMVACTVTDALHLRPVLEQLMECKLGPQFHHIKRVRKEGAEGGKPRFSVLLGPLPFFASMGGVMQSADGSADAPAAGPAACAVLRALGQHIAGYALVGVPSVPPTEPSLFEAECSAVWPMVRLPRPSATRPTTEAPGEDASTDSGCAMYAAAGLALARAQAEQGGRTRGCAILLPLEGPRAVGSGEALPGATVLRVGGLRCEVRGMACEGVGSTRTAVMEAVRAAAELDGRVAADSGAGEAGPSAAKRRCTEDGAGAGAISSAVQAGGDEPLVARYVCTGSDAFLTHEPDLFDAMACVHARVARVFFESADPVRGALTGVLVCDASGGRLHFQELAALNHRYGVYRVT